ncbi:MAG: hypothetical protein ABIT20_18475 [Gemmatimonadaceae bacterium]
MMRIRCLAVIAIGIGAATTLQAQSPLPPMAAEHCTPASGDAAAAIARAWQAAGLDRASGRIVHATSTDLSQQNFQSDRPYPPFFSMMAQGERWFDLSTRTERAQSKMSGLGVGGAPMTTILSSEQATFFVRDTLIRALPALFANSAATRAMSVWAVLSDWRAASDVKVMSRCVYREYPRLVVERLGVYGPERLYLDVKTGLPVKLDREEPHYLWGQVRSEFVYQTWIAAGELIRPGAVFHLVDGDVETERLDGDFSLVSSDSAPPMRIPASPAMKAELAMFLQALPVDTERVGHGMMVLKNRGYRHGVTMVRDTVFLLDATQGDARGRLDSAWIARLYPTHEAVVVVVTDLAWPHIAGVRYWVSRGATVVSHASSRAMLDRVIARRWTRTPDALEIARRAKPVRMRFVGVSNSLSLAGGALRLYPIDGIASEGALMAWSPSDRSLWASDYVQTVNEPAIYTTEVARAAKRVGIEPVKVAAEHLGPTDWSTITRLAAKLP